MESPVPMAVYYTGQRLLFRTNNGHVMTALKDISSTVFNLQEINSSLWDFDNHFENLSSEGRKRHIIDKKICKTKKCKEKEKTQLILQK